MTDDQMSSGHGEEGSPNAPKRKISIGADLTIVAILFLFLRIMAVADWNWDTAAEIADSFNFSDAVPIVFGTLFERPNLTGAVITIVMPLEAFFIFLLFRRRRYERVFLHLLIFACLLVTQIVLIRSYALWWALIAPSALFVVVLLIYHFARRRQNINWLLTLGRHAGAVLVVGLLFLAVTVKTPWSPEEIVETDKDTYRGYVMEVAPGFLKLLTDEREVLILNDSEIVRRTSVGAGSDG